MKILHTSDWHLGQYFKTRSREDEHQKFLNWLENIIEEQSIDILVVAGDIFDTQNPPKYALTMYHDFLVQMTQSSCKDVVIVAGNHDSVATIEMTKNFAKLLNIHIVGSGEEVEDVIVSIKKDDKLEAIVCAVPYLRDRVIRDASTLKDNKALEKEYKDGLKTYYKNIYEKAKEISDEVPIIATGHFTTTGASKNEDSDSAERELYIGKLSAVDSDILSMFDYVAMGHLHKSQKIDSKEYMRYSGSPIPLSFSEALQKKSVIVVEFEGKNLKETQKVDIPTFKGIFTIVDTLENIKLKIEEIKDIENRPFIDIIINGDILDIDIKDFKNEMYEKGVDIISIKKAKQIEDKVLLDEQEDIKLEQLGALNVFEKRLNLDEHIKDDAELKTKLIHEYNIILEELQNEDN